MKKIIIAGLLVLITVNSLFFTIVSGSPIETTISIEKVLTDNTKQAVTVTGQIANPVEDQQVTLMVYKCDSDYKNTDNILFIDQSDVEFESNNTFTIIFPLDMSIAVDTLTLRMGGSNITTPATFNFDLNETIKDYGKYFKNGNASGYTFTEGSNGKDYIISGIITGMTVADLKLADGVEVYNGSEKVTGKLGTGMEIRTGNVSVTVVIKGDLKGDGNTDIEDAKRLLEHLVGNDELSEAQKLALGGIVNESASAIKQLRAFLNFLKIQ